MVVSQVPLHRAVETGTVGDVENGDARVDLVGQIRAAGTFDPAYDGTWWDRAANGKGEGLRGGGQGGFVEQAHPGEVGGARSVIANLDKVGHAIAHFIEQEIFGGTLGSQREVGGRPREAIDDEVVGGADDGVEADLFVCGASVVGIAAGDADGAIRRIAQATDAGIFNDHKVEVRREAGELNRGDARSLGGEAVDDFRGP